MDCFVKFASERGGTIAPLVIPHKDLSGPALTNPSVLVLQDKIYVNLRNINYTLYHSEIKKFEHIWGPLVYIHPENEVKLKTTNIICELNDDLSIKNYATIDTSLLDKPPLWEFIGLEDGRLINWNNTLYLCGVRRDTTTNGEGRMELSEITFDGKEAKEISRFRIPTPGNKESYCEKNWMPILDTEYHYVKWTNPTEIVKVDKDNSTCETVLHKNYIPGMRDWRGSSQVVKWKNNYICLIHETDLFRSECGRKDATYRHRFIVWDSEWNIIKYSKSFSFMNGEIEFCCGMDKLNNDFLITFGYQDNAAYILKVSENIVEDFINE